MPPRPDEEEDVFGSRMPELISAPGIHVSRHPNHISLGLAATTSPGDRTDYNLYVQAVPEHIRQRSEAARQMAGSVLGDAATVSTTVDIDPIMQEVAVEIDIDQAEVCNLSAVAIRKHATDSLQDAFNSIRQQKPVAEWTGIVYGVDESFFGKPFIELRRSQDTAPVAITFHELLYDKDNSQFSAVSFRSSDVARITTYIEPTRGFPVRLVYWADVPYQKRRFRKDILDVSSDLLGTTPITIGLYFGGNVFVSLLKNQKTATGCTFVFPDGQELDGDAHNRPEILTALQQLAFCTDDTKVSQLFGSFLAEVRDQAQSKGNSQVVACIDLAYGSRAISKIEKYMDNFLDPTYIAQQADKQVTVSDKRNSVKEKRTISVIAEIKKEGVIGNVPQRMVHYLSLDTSFQPNIGTTEHRFTLFTGLDEEVYGDAAYVLPKYAYVYDRFNGGKLYSLENQLEPRLAGPEQQEMFADIIEDMINRSKAEDTE